MNLSRFIIVLSFLGLSVAAEGESTHHEHFLNERSLIHLKTHICDYPGDNLRGSRCGRDYHLNRRGRCVPDSTTTSNTTIRCGQNERLSRNGRHCVKVTTSTICDRGYHYSNWKGRCVADIGTGRDKENAAQKRQRQRDKRRVHMGRNR